MRPARHPASPLRAALESSGWWRLLGTAARSASSLAGSGRAPVIRLSSEAHAVLLHIASCVLARHPPVTTLGVAVLTRGTT
jgi:hypothetical protein